MNKLNEPEEFAVTIDSPEAHPPPHMLAGRDASSSIDLYPKQQV